MKRCLSILFFSLFFLSQYGKMLAYMECRIAAALESKKDCGCDNTLKAADADQNSSQPVHQHHLKNYTEEFFDHEWLTITDITIIPSRNFVSQYKQEQLPGHPHGILQPPRC